MKKIVNQSRNPRRPLVFDLPVGICGGKYDITEVRYETRTTASGVTGRVGREVVLSGALCIAYGAEEEVPDEVLALPEVQEHIALGELRLLGQTPTQQVPPPRRQAKAQEGE